MKKVSIKKDEIGCVVIQDLLPLYEDGCCSEESGRLVQEHLETCDFCREKSRLCQENLFLLEEDRKEEVEIKKIRRGIRQIKRWKVGGITAFLLALLLIFVVLPGWNYIHGSGITYTNLKAIYLANAFQQALVSGDDEKAYDYLDIRSAYDRLITTKVQEQAVREGIAEIQEKGFNWYDEVCREKFLECMKLLREEKENISFYDKLPFQISRQPGEWETSFKAKTTSGKRLRISLDIGSKGITGIYAAMDTQKNGIEDILAKESQNPAALLFDRLYRFPTLNETVMEILYKDTDFDWRLLFAY